MYSMDGTNSPSSDAIFSKSQLSSIYGAPVPTHADLPPAHIQQHLAEIYLQDVHPVFPLLSRSSIISRNYKPRSLVLALCAYCACLSPSLGSDDSGGGAAGVGDATRIAAEMWYVFPILVQHPYCCGLRTLRNTSCEAAYQCNMQQPHPRKRLADGRFVRVFPGMSKHALWLWCRTCGARRILKLSRPFYSSCCAIKGAAKRVRLGY
jgi:hypothetical protein